MAAFVFLFIDGVGIGNADDSNPFFQLAEKLGSDFLMPFFKEKVRQSPGPVQVAAIDCRLGMPGLPQSASGQTALFCGVGAEQIGPEPKNGYPGQALRRIIKKNNLLRELHGQGRRAQYVNAYPHHAKLFSSPQVRIDDDGRLHFGPSFPAPFKRMISVTSCMMIANGEKPLGEDALARGEALYQDYSNQALIDRGLQLPRVSPAQAGAILFRLARRYDFILYEYFQTDLFAHRHSPADCLELIENLNRLLGSLLSRLNERHDTLLLTSDHGNLEDLSHRGHTLNPVPLLVWGKHASFLRQRIVSIADVTPSIVQVL